MLEYNFASQNGSIDWFQLANKKFKFRKHRDLNLGPYFRHAIVNGSCITKYYSSKRVRCSSVATLYYAHKPRIVMGKFKKKMRRVVAIKLTVSV